jgi:hypothetical protein
VHGAQTIQQCLDAGLLDEIHIDLAAVGGFNSSLQRLVMEVVGGGCSGASAGGSRDAWSDVVAGSALDCAA